MNILVTGANGFLGQHLCIFLTKNNFAVTAASRGDCRIPDNNIPYYKIDLTDKKAVLKMVDDVQPDVIIHNAALSKPDECNNNKENCLLQNVETTKFLLNGLKALTRECKFIYISTDFIFGENGPHGEEDKPDPLNYYGESKLKAEQIVKRSNVPYAIVRPVFIYGPSWEGIRGSFLHWIRNSLNEHKKIKIVSDQLRTPTYVYDICKGIETIITQKAQGEFHLAGKDILSPYEMAVAVANVLKLDTTLIENVTSETFPEPVKRAKKSGLRIDKAIKELNYKPVSFEEGIKRTFNIN
jgi:dTDP-4-dehydrorhamnose reductase